MSENTNLQEDKPDFEVGFFNFPPITVGNPVLNMSDPGNVMFIPTNAEHPKEALELMDWFVTPPVAEYLAGKGILSTIQADVSSVNKPIPWMNDELAALQKQTPLDWINWSVSGLGDVTGPEVQRLLAGEATIDEVLKNFQAAYDKACGG
jgi:ABC-type glycerol-3-phosphate transport system substrate-binding protein